MKELSILKLLLKSGISLCLYVSSTYEKIGNKLENIKLIIKLNYLI